MSPVQFVPDRTTYLRSQAKTAAMAMAGAMVVLWLLNDPNIWVGAVAGLGAIGLRAWYLFSEEMNAVWTLGPDTLNGPMQRSVALAQITKVRTMGSFVQIITQTGDKHLIKYQADPEQTKTRIEAACSLINA
ncbi:MAG: hypothetical protein AB8B51_19840 [Sedimentitalea sp.]